MKGNLWKLDTVIPSPNPRAKPPTEPRSPNGWSDDLKEVIQRAQEKAVGRAKAADRVIRERPYQTIGLAFGLGVLIGVLIRRK